MISWSLEHNLERRWHNYKLNCYAMFYFLIHKWLQWTKSNIIYLTQLFYTVSKLGKTPHSSAQTTNSNVFEVIIDLLALSNCVDGNQLREAQSVQTQTLSASCVDCSFKSLDKKHLGVLRFHQKCFNKEFLQTITFTVIFFK